MIAREKVLNAITDGNRTVQEYAMDFFCVNEMADIQVINRILDALDNSDDKFEIIDYLGSE